jgi:hypothetical protein
LRPALDSPRTNVAADDGCGLLAAATAATAKI